MDRQRCSHCSSGSGGDTEGAGGLGSSLRGLVDAVGSDGCGGVYEGCIEGGCEDD